MDVIREQHGINRSLDIAKQDFLKAARNRDYHKIEIFIQRHGKELVNATGFVQQRIPRSVRSIFGHGFESNGNAFHQMIAGKVLKMRPMDATSQKIVQLLVDHGCDVNSPNRSHSRPLHFLLNQLSIVPQTAKSHKIAFEIASILLRHGAKVNVVDDQSHTPLDQLMDPQVKERYADLFATFYPFHLQEADLLKRAHLQGREMMKAIIQDDVELLTQLLNQRYDPNYKIASSGEEESSPLQLAITLGRKKCAECLIAAGADPFEQIQSKESGSNSLLILTLLNQDATLLSILLQSGLNPNERINGKMEAFPSDIIWHNFVLTGRLDLVKICLLHSIDLTIKTNDGCDIFAFLMDDRSPLIQRKLDQSARYIDEFFLNKINQDHHLTVFYEIVNMLGGCRSAETDQEAEEIFMRMMSRYEGFQADIDFIHEVLKNPAHFIMCHPIFLDEVMVLRKFAQGIDERHKVILRLLRQVESDIDTEIPMEPRLQPHPFSYIDKEKFMDRYISIVKTGTVEEYQTLIMRNPYFHHLWQKYPTLRKAIHARNFPLAKYVAQNSDNIEEQHQVVQEKPILLAALQRGDEELVEILLSKGAKSCCLDGALRNAMHYAAASGNLQLVKRVVSWDYPKEAVPYPESFEAAKSGNIDCLRYMLQNPHSHIVKDDFAPKFPWEDHFSFLYQIHITSDPLQYASRKWGTLMHGAVESGNMAMVEELVNLGARYGVANGVWETPLHIAASRGDERMVRFFWPLYQRQGIDDINFMAERGSLLFRAVKNGTNLDLVHYLLSEGASIHVEDYRRRTVRDLVTEDGYKNIEIKNTIFDLLSSN